MKGIPFLFVKELVLSLEKVPTGAALEPKKSYIVYLGSHEHGEEATDADFDRVTQTHYDFLGSYLGSSEKAKEAMIYSYTRYINGFAAMLRDEEAAEIEKHPKVVSVFLNRGLKLHTTRSWEFMSMEHQSGVISPASLFSKARFGEDTIIGNFDTGVWPESPSFSDEGIGPIPSRWKGSCEDGGPDIRCNRKLIGARYFNKGYAAYAGPDTLKNATLNTVRDYEGHGTHTLSTLGGNFVPGANVFGFGNGTAEGGSPKARVVSYKVCWPPIFGDASCFAADIMAAFDMAIHDGVDILSLSLGGVPIPYFKDGVAIGAFHAFRKGITVVISAGNQGPDSGSVSNVAPWMLNVAASTLDREFNAVVELENGERFKGESLAPGMPQKKFYPLISGLDAKLANATDRDALMCKIGTIDPEKAKGKILVCKRGATARVKKSLAAMEAGAVGMILCNDKLSGNELIADLHFLPSSHITYEDGLQVFAYLNSTKNPMGYIVPPETKLHVKPAPFMSSFSSRGPNTVTHEILKPDVTAPGINIIAAFSEAASPTQMSFDKRRAPFVALSGTSMSCPHVAGIAGLLKTLHPEWSPSAIKSAILTSAGTRDNKGEPMLDGDFKATTPFEYGFGHVRPNRAMDPGLVYDTTIDDYLNFLCAIGYDQKRIKVFSGALHHECPHGMGVLDFNYPSITVPVLYGRVTVTRRVRNVGSPGTYVASFHNIPSGLSLSVNPNVLKFESVGEEKSFKVIIEVAKPGRAIVFGDLIWSDGKHYVKTPITVGGIKA
ncbi:subtilisin-like protease SBT5.4 [Arachis stenosperma]|uniref:subtilisin-like protease SBT5.4 n=1 Tax=Arachis stenosperma TaxID=217475 RepID=UPI0025AC3738|nr:subtilisin-like protease SBT5.4 [Arachis stenosperma]